MNRFSKSTAPLSFACLTLFLASCGEQKSSGTTGDTSAPAGTSESTGPSVDTRKKIPVSTIAPKVETPDLPQTPEAPEPPKIPDNPTDAPAEPPAEAPSAPQPVRPAVAKERVPSPVKVLPPGEKEVPPKPIKDPIAFAKEAKEKSELAGKTYVGFVDAKNNAERLKWIQNASGLKTKMESYHDSHPNRAFKILDTVITGVGRRLNDPSKLVFPYYVATDKNPHGFLVLIYEEATGMKLSWEHFAYGQDYSLHDFTTIKDKKPHEFLAAIKRAHIFDPTIPESKRDQLVAVKLDLPRVARVDKPIAYAKADSDIGRALIRALPWGKLQLCRITLQHDSAGRLTIHKYGKLAHPTN